MKDQESFKPYIPAEKITAEMTATSVIMGIILSVVFGAANAYLGLRVGMTVSASIPAAVISMGVIRVLLKKNSILESNMVQTIGSAGESLAAGAIFTMPALFLWAKEGLCDKPSILEITLIALCGGILGVLFMVPLRNALIVKEHATLLYPEGTACADVLLAGEEGGANASTVFSGMGLAAIFKFIVDGLKMIPADIAVAFSSFKGALGMEVYPALLGVGYIVGPKTASYMFTGSLVGWMVIIPLICLFGANISLYPAAAGTTIADLYAAGGADAIWSNYVKYIGAGAIATGGIISLIKSLPLIASTFRDAMKSMKGGSASGTSRTEKDLPMPFILGGILLIILIIWLAPAIPVSPLGALLIVIFGFFFSTVSARMVGMIGSSNNPVSGMTIATLLIATMILKATGNVGIEGMIGSMAIASVICICAAIAADTSQDLKTGYLLGATPVKQQIGELIGVIAAGLAIGGVLAGVICIADPLREEASEVLKQLRGLGIRKAVMMTGDNDRTASVIAKQVGVDHYYAEVLPEDKANFVEQEKAAGHTVIMLGDGINDSPALSAADVGIAISDGAAIAREIADVTIAADSLRELVILKSIANGLQKRTKSNYRFIMSFNSTLIVLGAMGILPPATSALLHNASTLGVSCLLYTSPSPRDTR